MTIPLDEIKKLRSSITGEPWLLEPDNGETCKIIVGDGRWRAFNHHLPENAAFIVRSPSIVDALISMIEAPAPIDMILFCPRCGLQHVDAPESDADFEKRHAAWKQDITSDSPPPTRWTNPPHRSHLCHGCKYVWRPADIETNGAAEIQTKGSIDSPPIRGAMDQQRKPANNLTVKLFIGKEEIPITTKTELALVAALKAILWEHGNKPTVNRAMKEFYMNRFAFIDAVQHQVGDIQIAEDGNNGRDHVRLIKTP
jgi:hypothetical protein